MYNRVLCNVCYCNVRNCTHALDIVRMLLAFCKYMYSVCCCNSVAILLLIRCEMNVTWSQKCLAMATYQTPALQSFSFKSEQWESWLHYLKCFRQAFRSSREIRRNANQHAPLFHGRQKHFLICVKSAKPIRNNIANRQAA